MQIVTDHRHIIDAHLLSVCDQAVKVQSAAGIRPLAVLDADGTLWNDDLGEAFFRWQVESGRYPFIEELKQQGVNLWQRYQELDRQSTALASGWLAQTFAGRQLAHVRDEARGFYFKMFHAKLDPVIRSFLTSLHDQGVEVWICTASPQWSVEPVLEDLKLPLHQIIGTRTGVNNEDLITDLIVRPIPYAEGKRQWITDLFDTEPFLVAGNTIADAAMMELATHVALAVRHRPYRAGVMASEEKLQDVAKKKGWFTLVLPTPM